MRVFVAGATGAIGRPLVPKLVAAGHEVTGMTRSEKRAEGVRAAGARAVVCDAFDADAVRSAVGEAGAEAVAHQLTALPDRIDFRDKELYTATNRLRSEGTSILLAAAREGGARRFVCQSIAFAYAPAGERVMSEEAPLMKNLPGNFGEGVRVIAEMERQGSKPRAWTAWSCATASSTARAPTTGRTARPPGTCAAAGCRWLVAAPASSPSSTLTTPPTPP